MHRGEARAFGLHLGESSLCLGSRLGLALSEPLASRSCCGAIFATIQLSDEIVKALIQSIPVADHAIS